MRVPVTVTLNERTWELKYDLNALAALKQKCGINLLNPDTTQDFDGDPVVVRALLWAGLIHADRLLDLEAVGAWVDMSNVVEVATKAAEALQAAMTPEVSADRSGP